MTYSRVIAKFLLAIFLAASVPTYVGGQAPSTACQSSIFFRQSDKETATENNVRRIITYQRSVMGGPSFVIFSERMKVNADGNLRAYGSEDLIGNKCASLPANVDPEASGCSMGHIANGVNVIRNGVRLNTSDTVRAIRAAKLNKWQKSGGLTFDFFALAKQRGNSSQVPLIPCETPNGFFVSQASALSGIPARPFMGLPAVCDQKQYLDSAIPSIVVPKCWNANFRRSNPSDCPNTLGIPSQLDVKARSLATVRDSNGNLHFVVVGDFGPAQKLGEVSVGLASKIRNVPLPKTYRTLNAISDQRMDVVVFPEKQFGGPLDTQNMDQMEAMSERAFVEWRGNTSESNSQLTSCGLAARQP
jgi:hypothetical protein